MDHRQTRSFANFDFNDDGRHSADGSFHTGGQVGGQDMSSLPFQFQQSQPDNTTHYVGKSPKQFVGQSSLENFIIEDDSPWAPALTNHGGMDVAVRPMNLNISTDFAHLGSFSGAKAISEGHAQSDSGYKTMSRGSNEFGSLYTQLQQHTGPQSVSHSYHVSPNVKSKLSRSKSESITCQECGRTLQNKSDWVKHTRMHTKPYHCPQTDCKRHVEGFTTQNDMKRHVKSVHTNGYDGESKSWQCAGRPCKDPSKPWPRFDNFKQHVLKMHPTEDLEDVIQRSEISPGSIKELESTPQVVDPANLSTQATANSPLILITPDSNSGTNAFTPINDGTGMLQSSTSLAVPSPVKSRSSGGSAPASPINTNEALTPTASSDGASLAYSRKLSTAKSSVMDISETADELQILTALMGSASAAMRCIVSGSSVSSGSNAKKLELYQQIRVAAMRLPNAEHSTPLAGVSPLDQTADAADGPLRKCEVCNKVMKRSCDMKKHMKRHTKPYGCTWSHCFSNFGSKNDWKRHESTQHEVRDLWKCCESGKNAFGICGQSFYRQKDFETHLAKDHKYCSDVVGVKASSSMLSRNNHTQFWCGFCLKLLRSDDSGGLVQNERFTHVSDHFIKNNMNIKDWVDVEEHRTKREILADIKARRSPEDMEDMIDLGDAGAEASEVVGEGKGDGGGFMHPPLLVKGSKKRAREGEQGEPQSKPKKQKPNQQQPILWTCCECTTVNHGMSGDSGCVDCGHFQCKSCSM